jgi:hypothetical protein
MKKRFSSVIAGAARLRPADWLRRSVRAGLLAAIIVAGVAASVDTFQVSRECGGAFSQGFSASFDRYHCDLVIRSLKTDYQIKVPPP